MILIWVKHTILYGAVLLIHTTPHLIETKHMTPRLFRRNGLSKTSLRVAVVQLLFDRRWDSHGFRARNLSGRPPVTVKCGLIQKARSKLSPSDLQASLLLNNLRTLQQTITSLSFSISYLSFYFEIRFILRSLCYLYLLDI